MTKSTSDPITADELSELLVETGNHHHEAYLSADGTDPEWPLWYAGYLQSRLWDRAGALPTRSMLVHLLLAAEADHKANGGDTPWANHFSTFMLTELTAS